MITVNIRKQGGAAIITVPANVLKLLDLGIGSTLEINVDQEGFTARPIKETHKRYTIAELLHGIKPAEMKAINKKVSWSGKGKSVGREMT